MGSPGSLTREHLARLPRSHPCRGITDDLSDPLTKHLLYSTFAGQPRVGGEGSVRSQSDRPTPQTALPLDNRATEPRTWQTPKEATYSGNRQIGQQVHFRL